MGIIQAAYDAFCEKRFPLPTEKQVADLEEKIGISFPDDYRQFLLEFNGGFFNEPHIIPLVEECPLDRLTFMNGIGATHPDAELCNELDLVLFTDNDPPQILPIGYTIMGYLILLVTHPENRGAIVLKGFEDSWFLAEDIEEFFGLLHEPLYD
jgi:hypothetical protein